LKRYSHGVVLEVGIISDSLEIECRDIEISQVLLNLLNNAYDAVTDKEDKWVRIDVKETESAAIITVTDSGPGIPENIRNKITQPFFTTKELGKGTGLGLSISLGIVGAHQGNLTLDTHSSHTCFVVTLPKRRTVSAGAAA
jgi:C4-dicarboxylate-specific signal transduction histidine kinase